MAKKAKRKPSPDVFTPAEDAPFIACHPKTLPEESWLEAARLAVAENPVNAPQVRGLAALGKAADKIADPAFIAVLTSKYWRGGGVKLSVQFMDGGSATLRNLILSHMNSWGVGCNVKFAETRSTGQVRITRTPGSGYWSYLGTDVLLIPANQPTMNLDSFSERTSIGEYKRVVRHETGHTLGCPHEHMRAELIARLDRERTIRYFQQTQGWSRGMVTQQVLTPLSETSLIGSAHAEADSIMCYQLPGSITRDGRPIVGGTDITRSDMAFMGRVYPKLPTAKPKK